MVLPDEACELRGCVLENASLVATAHRDHQLSRARAAGERRGCRLSGVCGCSCRPGRCGPARALRPGARGAPTSSAGGPCIGCRGGCGRAAVRFETDRQRVIGRGRRWRRWRRQGPGPAGACHRYCPRSDPCVRTAVELPGAAMRCDRFGLADRLREASLAGRAPPARPGAPLFGRVGKAGWSRPHPPPTRRPPSPAGGPRRPPARGSAPSAGALLTGGFSPGGHSFPLPPSSLPLSPRFFFFSSDRLTPWYNDPVSDPHGEALYLRDEDGLLVADPRPVASAPCSVARYGFGYTRSSDAAELAQETCVFVPRAHPSR